MHLGVFLVHAFYQLPKALPDVVFGLFCTDLVEVSQAKLLTLFNFLLSVILIEHQVGQQFFRLLLLLHQAIDIIASSENLMFDLELLDC